MTLQKTLLISVALGLGACLVATAPVMAQSAQARVDVPALDGAVSARAMSRLQSGERTSVIVILNVSQDETLLAGEPGFAGQMMRQQIDDMRRAVTGRVFARNAESLGRQDAVEGYEAFELTPGFTIMANAREIAELRANPDVAHVYDNTPMRPMTDTSIQQVGAPAVWARGFDGGGVAVAVLDTGVEKDHPMIGPAITASACYNTTITGESSSLCPNGQDTQIDLTSAEAGDACVEDDFDAETGIDGCFHGTHVASTVAGRQLNLSSGRTVSGVARSASIIAVNVFSRFEPAECVEDDEPIEGPCTLSYPSDQIAALDWLYLNRDTLNLGAVNMSLGGSTANASPCTSSSYDRTMGALNDAGIAVVVAAGNDGFANGLSSPACIRSAISVGAVDDSDEVPTFSNDADYLDLLAPGVDITAAFGTEEPPAGQNCVINDATPNSEGFCHWFSSSNGTSMATPHVAGAMALLRDAFPNASVADFLQALKVTGVPVMDAATQRIHARIQVDDAFTFLNEGAGVVNSVSLSDLTRYDARNTTSAVSSFNTAVRALNNASFQARTVRVISKPSWLTTEFFFGSGTPSGAPASTTALTLSGQGAGQLRLSIADNGLNQAFNSGELVLGVDGASTRIRIKTTAFVATALNANQETVRFGPFEWVSDVDQGTSSIFRVVGLNTAMPSAVSADIERWGDAAGQSVTDASIRCDFSVRANRYSGNEYIIGGSDFVDCARFDRGDLYIDVTVDSADASTVRMRRFLFNSSGGITDAAFDPSSGQGQATSGTSGVRVQSVAGPSSETFDRAADGLSIQESETSAPQATIQAEYGPFEWTYDANGALRSEFRLTPVLQGDALIIDVAIANASQSGYAGAFSDCRLTIRSNRRSENDFLILPEDLAECGAFGRADLTFRVTAEDSRVNYSPGDIDNMRMQRLIRQASGSLTDFHIDAQSSVGVVPASIGGGVGQVSVGPFEWTGDSTAATSNQFRIAGIANGAVTRIDVSIANATASGYSGTSADCTLAIRPQRAGANDYLILREDLVDCGAFGRGDLTFTVQASLTAMASRIKIRRIAFGAQGDITDFGFDAENGQGKSPTAISGGREEVVFGPFEWVGDANAGTKGVFRITGIDGGLPDSIEVAIANAAGGNGQFTGAYSDCLITLRSNRAGRNEYVIGAADFVDCGSFSRGDLSFRIRANAAVLADTVRMRRFAVTTAGGLTDFGFDND
jgi:subtilisin family serine protease